MEFQIRRVHEANGLPAYKRGLSLVDAATAAEALGTLAKVGLHGVTVVGDDGCYAYGFGADGQRYDAVAFDGRCQGVEPADVAAIPYG